MYFSKQIEQTGSHQFTIPFSRNEMADFYVLTEVLCQESLARCEMKACYLLTKINLKSFILKIK